MADLTHDSQDDGFHEIQLSGKQLVFLFMATTVISVVIFLCGVLVGRSVQGEGIAADAGLAVAEEPESPPIVPATDQSGPPPAPAEAELGYATRLEEGRAPEKLKPAEEETVAVKEITTSGVDEAVPPPETSSAPESRPTPEPKREETREPAAGSGPRPGIWAVQVISLSDRAAARQMVQRLQSKGYPAFLISPAAGAPTQLYKVQVGRYRDRAEAEKIDARLKKEKFDTWIVR